MNPRACFLTSALFLSIAACGDDGGGGDVPDAARPDAPPRACTSLPPVEDRGAPSPASLEIDPQPIDQGTPTAFAPEAITEDTTAFPLSPAAGGMRDDQVIVTGKATPEATVTLRVWRDGATAGQVVLVDERTVVADAAGFLQETVTGLAPDTLYRYAWFVGTAPTFTGRTVIGRVRTPPPAGGKVQLRVAASTCTGSANEASRAIVAPFPALSAMAAEEPDLVLHVGDTSYNDDAQSLAEYRQLWVRTLGELGYRDLLPAAGAYLTWDDHEVDDNFDPETIDPQRLADAKQAFFETLPVERGDGDRLWTSYQWGDAVEVIVTDLRSERLPSTRETAAPHFISAEQMAFLKDRLQQSTATFKLVFSSVNIANLSPSWDIPLAFADRWEGWGAQREELLDFIVDSGIRNVYFIAGDIHMGFVGRLEPEGHPYAKMWEITVGPGASEVNPLGSFYEGSDDEQRDGIFPCNQFVFAHGRIQVATMLTLDPGNETLGVTFTDVTTDEVLFDGVLQQED